MMERKYLLLIIIQFVFATSNLLVGQNSYRALKAISKEKIEKAANLLVKAKMKNESSSFKVLYHYASGILELEDSMISDARYNFEIARKSYNLDMSAKEEMRTRRLSINLGSIQQMINICSGRSKAIIFEEIIFFTDSLLYYQNSNLQGDSTILSLMQESSSVKKKIEASLNQILVLQDKIISAFKNQPSSEAKSILNSLTIQIDIERNKIKEFESIVNKNTRVIDSKLIISKINQHRIEELLKKIAKLESEIKVLYDEKE